MSNKQWGIWFVVLAAALLIGVGTITAVVDPYFHYHAPLEQLEYPLYNERYQNDGIVRHFTYNAIIAGTSMTENFKTTEFDSIFEVTSVKVPFAGASFKEVNDNLERALASNPDISIIIRSIDGNMITWDKDQMRLEEYPTYLTDDAYLNDVYYLLNKTTFFDGTLKVLRYTLTGNTTTSFDEYASWAADRENGEAAILGQYVRYGQSPDKGALSVQERETICANIQQNIIALAKENPTVDFYCFFPPYSIYKWDYWNRQGSLQQRVEAFELASQLLLEQENIHLFSFFHLYDMVTNPDNYSDTEHYRQEINSQILRWMHQGEHQVFKSNYEDYWDRMYEYYSTFDYDSLFS